MDEKAPAARGRTWPLFLAKFLGLVVFYRILVGSNDPAEWVTGLIASAIAAFGVAVVEAELPAQRVLAWRTFRLLALGPRMVAESVRVACSALAREMPVGSFAVVAIDPGGDDAESSGRRGLVVWGASLAPNGVVVTLDRDNRAMLVHRLLAGAGTAGGEDREWPL